MCQTGHNGQRDASIMLCNEGLDYYLRAMRRAPQEAEKVPECLVDLGLIRIAGDRIPRPIAPELAAGLRLAPMRRELADRQEELLDLEGEYSRLNHEIASAAEREPGECEVIRGGSLISEVLRMAVANCTSRLRTMQPGGMRPPELLEHAKAADTEALRRGVRQQTIYQHAILAHQPTLEYIHDVVTAGAEVRTLDHMADRLIICDEETAFIPVDLDRSDAALRITNPAIVAFLGRVFDTHWQRARTLGGVGPGRKPDYAVDESQALIMRLLVSGATDARIARETGMSVRTVSAQVHKLAKMLGSRSRAQLGYLIAAHGLINETDPGLPRL